MIFLSKIKLKVFCYVTEEINLVQQVLLECLPKNMRSVIIKKEILQSQFKDNLIVLLVSIDKKNEIKQVMDYLVENIVNKEFLSEIIDQQLDITSKVLHFRINKFKAISNILEITSGSDVIKCEIAYTTYVDDDNTYDQVISLFKEARLIM